MTHDLFWMAIRSLPETKSAVEAYAGAPYLGLLTTDELIERFQMLFVATTEMSDDGFILQAPWTQLHNKWIHAAVELTFRDLSPIDERAKPDWSFVRTPRLLSAVAAWKRRRLEWGPMCSSSTARPGFFDRR